jgi:hypothetical protein
MANCKRQVTNGSRQRGLDPERVFHIASHNLRSNAEHPNVFEIKKQRQKANCKNERISFGFELICLLPMKRRTVARAANICQR